MYDMSDWFFQLKNLFEKLDGLSSEQSYRRVFDNIEEFMDSYQNGDSPRQAHEDYWT